MVASEPAHSTCESWCREEERRGRETERQRDREREREQEREINMDGTGQKSMVKRLA
jgi:hypothetical protein